MNFEEGYGRLCGEIGGEAWRILGIQASDWEKASAGDASIRDKVSAAICKREQIYAEYLPEQAELLRQVDKLIASMKSGSLNKAASQIGLSAAVLSKLRSGTYTGNITDCFEKLRAYFEIKQAHALNYKEVEYAPTAVSESVYEAIRSVQIKGGCGIITGDAGIGKTKAIDKFISDNSDKAVVITPTPLDGSVNAVMAMLAEELGAGTGIKPSALKRAVLSRLHDGMVIIVDEAQLLRLRSIDMLRTFSDVFARKGETLGVVFVGNHSFRDIFEGRTAEKSAQIKNRAIVRPRYTVADTTFKDMCMLFPELNADGRTAELKFLFAIAQTPNEGTRAAVRLYSNARDSGNDCLDALVSWAKASEVEIKNLTAILKRLNGEVA